MNRLTQWVIDKIEKEYRDDVALLVAVTGHATNGDMHGECFDYFIPATTRGEELAQTFIIDGVGHDLYPRTWERMERTANLDEMTICLANATILYARSREDEERFYVLQDKLAENLNNKVFLYQKAVEKLDDAMEVYRTLMFEERWNKARMAAGYIHLYLTQAVAYLNGTFAESPVFSVRQMSLTSPQSRLYSCPQMKELPDGFFEKGGMILEAKSINELQVLAHELILTTKAFLSSRKPALVKQKEEPDYQALADWYQELSLTWRRIRYFCMKERKEEAFVDACYLQSELAVVAQEFGFEQMDLLSAYDAEHLEHLMECSDRLEQQIREIILSHGAKIEAYDTLQDFLSQNSVK